MKYRRAKGLSRLIQLDSVERKNCTEVFCTKYLKIKLYKIFICYFRKFSFQDYLHEHYCTFFVPFESEVIKYKSSRLIQVFLKILTFHSDQKSIIRTIESIVNNICLKTDTILLQYTFYQFQYFIITCLHGQNLSTKVSVKKF